MRRQTVRVYWARPFLLIIRSVRQRIFISGSLFFALLKTNDVQLIVPARGATPAITGKFDVNYVLGQKLMNHRQQTIVVDYHSNVKIDEMEYVKINYEQEVFDFV